MRNYFELSSASLKERLGRMRNTRRKEEKKVEKLHVSISDGNIKLGAIPSVSLLPVIDCVNCGRCKRGCYDVKTDCIWTSTIIGRARNSAIFHHDRERYFGEIEKYLTNYYPRAFRWHVGGDITDMDYFLNMVRIAEKFTDTKFLAFTKNFGVVNQYLDEGKIIPKNLKVIFSGWLGLKMDNPHNLPTSHPIFDDGKTSAPEGAMACTGNCMDCFKDDRLCWSIEKGEAVTFKAH